jgi:hypothetical protein
MDIYSLKGHLGHTLAKTAEIYLAFLTPDEAEKAKRPTAHDTAQSRRFGNQEIAQQQLLSMDWKGGRVV